MRYVAALLIASLGFGGWFLTPDRPVEDLGFAPGLAEARFAACISRVDRLFGSQLTVAGAFVAPASLARAAESAGEFTQVRVDDTGAGMFDLADLGSTGLDGIFVEFTAEDTAAGVLGRGDGGLVGATCTPPSSRRLTATGLSTRNAELLDLVLINPYASDAVVSVESSSEVGADSASELEQVLVPARSTVVRDLAAILPLRQQLSVSILVTEGAVHAFLMQTGGDDVKIVEAVEPATAWFLPVPGIEGLRLTVANPTDLEVEIRVDAFVGSTVLEGVVSEVVPARSHLVLDPTQFDLEPIGPIGLAVFAASDVSVGFWADQEGIRMGAPAPKALAGSWVVPARLGGPATLWVLNPDSIELEGVVRPLLPGTAGRTVKLAPNSVTAIPIDGLGPGYSFTAPGDVAVVWTSVAEVGAAAGVASPLSVIGEED